MMKSFVGTWTLSRRIEDLRDGTLTLVNGTATLTPDGAGLVWEEAGSMHRPDGAVLRVGRRYLWRGCGYGRIEVLFADGRPFHDFDPSDASEAEHLCGADRYHVRYAFDLPKSWCAVWRVIGPAKDYVSSTELRRSA